MKNTTLFSLLLLGFFLFSCKGNLSNQPEIKRQVFQESPLTKAYAPIRPSVQKISVNNEKPTVIEAAGGTEIMIPENCFVDHNGKPVKGEVVIEVVEAFNMTDFISSGLTTLSNGQLLLSNGMMNIDAKADGKSLQIKNGKALTVSMPTTNSNEGYQMFTGDGENWMVDSTMLAGDYLISLPLNLLYPNGNDELRHCYTEEGQWEKPFDTTLISFTDPKYEKTIIATKEFRERLLSLWIMTLQISILNNQDFYYGKVDCRDQIINFDLFKIYYQNPNQSFSYLDSIALKTHQDYFSAHKEDLIEFSDSINAYNERRHLNGERTSTQFYFFFTFDNIQEYWQRIIDYFPKGNLNKVKVINDYGVNLNAPDAYDQLVRKKVSPVEINDILQYHFKRQEIIDELKRQQQAIIEKKKLEKTLNSVQFALKELGWINCDRFYNDPNAAEAEIILANSSTDTLNYIDFSLVIPRLNARLKSFTRADGSYSFTKEEGPYTKLPIGEEALVFGIAIKNDSLYYASQQIKIKDQLKLNLNLKYIETNALSDSLDLALSLPQKTVYN